MKKTFKQLQSQVMSEMAKQSHKKKPRSKEFYVAMANKRWKGKAKKKGDKPA